MSANLESSASGLTDAAISTLRSLLPDSWQVELSSRTGTDGAPMDGAIEIRDPRGTINVVATEAKATVDPRSVERLAAAPWGQLRSLAGHIPLLVVARWVSPRARELLERNNINYVDLTGNVLVRLDNPALYLRTEGAARNPSPVDRPPAAVRGPKAARLLRLLMDVRPPYAVGELAAAARLTQGYVSRLLDALDREALVERSRRGRVEHADIAGLAHRWAESYDVLRSNEASWFLAPAGARAALELLAENDAVSDQAAVTGSFAASRLAPVAAPALLMAYAEDPATLARALNLWPADEGANVVLLRPFDSVVWERTLSDGVPFVAPSQATADCLTGTGRMPAEGEALLSWMIEHEPVWRAASLAELHP